MACCSAPHVVWADGSLETIAPVWVMSPGYCCLKYSRPPSCHPTRTGLTLKVLGRSLAVGDRATDTLDTVGSAARTDAP